MRYRHIFINRINSISFIYAFIRFRFIRFGVVGFSGTLVNLGLLYLNQEFLFKDIHPFHKRLHISLSIAIFLATVNNYLWNRLWTWGDRKGKTRYGFFIQMGQYFLACSVPISLQYVFTIFISRTIFYLIANIIAIILAAIFVYIINDIWTFGIKRNSFFQK
jgi:putative flippase GtrA